MPITKISIQNYKSLRSVTFLPKPLSVIVGPNGAGKTNFADCLDFIGEVYREGLEVAVSRKGGYENIAFRRQQRSKLPIRIEIVLEISSNEFAEAVGIPASQRAKELGTLGSLQISHSFEFVARSTAIRSQFDVTHENYTLCESRQGKWQTLWSITINNRDFTISPQPTPPAVEDNKPRHMETFAEMVRSGSDWRFFEDIWSHRRPRSELLVHVARYVVSFLPLLLEARNIGVFQINPMKSRESGVPSSHPELERSGGNLPAVIDEMQKNRKEAWSSVLEVMRTINPDLKSINVDYTLTKRLGLFFREAGYGRAWTVEEMSDGTLQTLAVLVAIFNPSSSFLVLEELENSVHPWIIRRILEACVKASKSKQIVLTTHSPIVIDSLSPENIWVIWREKGESQLEELVKMDKDVLQLWADGSISTFNFIDSGVLPVTTPPFSSDVELESEAALG